MKRFIIGLLAFAFAGSVAAVELGIGASTASALSGSGALSGGSSSAGTAFIGLAAANNSGQAVSGNVSSTVVSGNDILTTSVSEAAHTNTSTSGALGGAISGATGTSGAGAIGGATGTTNTLFLFANP